MLNLLSSNLAALSIIGAAVAFAWSVVQFVLTRRRDSEVREFEIYHRLIKELVSPDPVDGATRVDRQAAVIFELRHFPRYSELSLRTLSGLRQHWASDPMKQYPRLIEEIDLTLACISKTNAFSWKALQPTARWAVADLKRWAKKRPLTE